MSENDDEQLLAELENLLKKQIALARRGSFSELEDLAGRCEKLTAKIKESGLLENPGFKGHRLRLEKLYKDLYLIAVTQKAATEAELKRIRKGKRVIAHYRRNIASF